MWIGGASLHNPAHGAIVGVKLSTGVMFHGDTTNSPITTGSLKKTLIYFGQKNGEVKVFDVVRRAVVSSFPTQPGVAEVNVIVADQTEDGVWMATRRIIDKVSSWCFQQYYRLPEMRPLDEGFSGHYPGPCTGLTIDATTNQLFWTDSSARGRWHTMRTAVARDEIMWDNGFYITRSTVLKNAQYVLLTNGRLEVFPYATFTKTGPAEIAVTFKVNAATLGEQWSTLVADADRDSIWAASEDGHLVELAINSDYQPKQVAALKTRTLYRFVGGATAGAKLALIDQGAAESRLVLLTFSTSCPLGSAISCRCAPSQDDASRDLCIVTQDVTINAGQSLVVPSNIVVDFRKDAVFKPGSLLTMGLSSSLQSGESITIEGARLYISDNGRSKSATHELIKATHGVVGSFKSASVTRMTQLKRMLMCAQMPRVKVLIGTEVKVEYKVSGSCKSPVITLPIVLILVGGLVYIAFKVFASRAEEKAADEKSN